MEVNVEEELEVELEEEVEVELEVDVDVEVVVEVLVEVDCYRARENCTQIETEDNGKRRHCRSISRM